jgi:hypothetical protein
MHALRRPRHVAGHRRGSGVGRGQGENYDGSLAAAAARRGPCVIDARRFRRRG